MQPQQDNLSFPLQWGIRQTGKPKTTASATRSASESPCQLHPPTSPLAQAHLVVPVEYVLRPLLGNGQIEQHVEVRPTRRGFSTLARDSRGGKVSGTGSGHAELTRSAAPPFEDATCAMGGTPVSSKKRIAWIRT